MYKAISFNDSMMKGTDDASRIIDVDERLETGRRQKCFCIEHIAIGNESRYLRTNGSSSDVLLLLHTHNVICIAPGGHFILPYAHIQPTNKNIYYRRV